MLDIVEQIKRITGRATQDFDDNDEVLLRAAREIERLRTELDAEIRRSEKLHRRAQKAEGAVDACWNDMRYWVEYLTKYPHMTSGMERHRFRWIVKALRRAGVRKSIPPAILAMKEGGA